MATSIFSHAKEDLETLWLANYAALQAFVNKNGRLPRQKESPDDSPSRLGAWVDSQRRTYQKGTIPQERVTLLEAVPGWYWRRSHDKSWLRMYDALCEFVRERSRLPKRTETAGGQAVGMWCINQRAARKYDELSAEKAALLDRVPGWYWEQDVVWRGMLASLHGFVRLHRRLPAADEPAAWRAVGRWAEVQRRARAGGWLAADKAALLDQVPGWHWGGDAAANDDLPAAKRRR